MAYALHRSMNAELDEGGTDGKYKKVIYDRGGLVEADTLRSRLDLDDQYYGIHEEQVKVRPDQKVVVTPNYRYVPPATDVY